MPRLQLAACLVLLALGVIACGLLREQPDPIVDGWPVGDALDCTARTDCGELLGLARAALDARRPGHAAVDAAALHAEGSLVDPVTGDRILMTRSGGGPMIAVFELADGQVAAIGVGYPGISQVPIVYQEGP